MQVRFLNLMDKDVVVGPIILTPADPRLRARLEHDPRAGGRVIRMPPPCPGVAYVVPKQVFDGLPSRGDLVTPIGFATDDQDRIDHYLGLWSPR